MNVQQMSDTQLAVHIAWLMGLTVEFGENGYPLGTVDDNDNLSNLKDYPNDRNACAEMEAELARRGLVKKYIDALIDVLGLDMQVFNSAIELSPYMNSAALDIPNNPFEWEGYAYLWLWLTATPRQRCEAAYAAVNSET